MSKQLAAAIKKAKLDIEIQAQELSPNDQAEFFDELLAHIQELMQDGGGAEDEVEADEDGEDEAEFDDLD